MYTPVDPTIKEKIISAYLAGHGRNQIDRELHEQKIKVSHGSISNIINAYKRHEQSLQLPQLSNNSSISTGVDMNNTDGSPLLMARHGSGIGKAVTNSFCKNSNILKDREQPEDETDRVSTFPEQTLSEIEFKKNPDISIENHAIINTQDFEENGHPPIDLGLKGGPLSWFMNGYGSETKSENSQPQSKFEASILTASPKGQQPQQLQQQKELVANVVELESIPEPETSVQVEKLIDEKPLPEATVSRPKSTIEDRLEYERDHQWQNYGPVWYRLMDQMKKEKYGRRHELLVIDTRKKKLEEWKRRLEQMQYDLTTRESNLKDRETRVFEVEPFLSVAKNLQNLGIDMGLALPWIEVIRKRAETENVDIRICANNLAQELTQYGALQKQIERANQELALINMTTIQKQQVIRVIEDLKNKGVTESQVVQLVNFAEEWSRYWSTAQPPNGSLQPPGSPLVPNLQQPSGPPNGNLQQSNNGSNNSGYGGGNISTNELRLNLLKSNIAAQLSRAH